MHDSTNVIIEDVSTSFFQPLYEISYQLSGTIRSTSEDNFSNIVDMNGGGGGGGI